MHLSRFAEDLILWSSQEFGFITLPDAFATGSSIMPQKKNPDVAELIRGKTGRLYGNLLSLLTTLKGLPMTYNRDLQEDKEPVFDSVDTIQGQPRRAHRHAAAAADQPQRRMAAAATAGYTLATELADYLSGKGVPFREAHGIVGAIVRHCVQHDLGLEALTVEQLRGFSPHFARRCAQVAAGRRRRCAAAVPSAARRPRMSAANCASTATEADSTRQRYASKVERPMVSTRSSCLCRLRFAF